MDCVKVGRLIYNLRKEKNMTQKEIACALNISDKTVSKWERGLGCPDVSLLGELSNVFGVSINKILAGDLQENEVTGGNMRRIKFYVCSNCHNVINSTGEGEISCCGRKLEPLVAKKEDEEHTIVLEEIDHEYYLTINHEMTKDHFISFIAFVSYDRVLLVKLYPEQNAELRIPRMNRGKLYVYCSLDGLFEKDVNPRRRG